ncbi:MAG: hypothetical protein Q8Q18_01210 [bacterium]|nr:hypothetical protein [bacterium]
MQKLRKDLGDAGVSMPAFLITVVAIIIFVSAGYYQQNSRLQPRTDGAVNDSEPLAGEAKDPACTGKQDESWPPGFGIEKTWTGSITSGKNVSATLSCDLTKLTISGAVEQVITREDIHKVLLDKKLQNTAWENLLFIDTSDSVIPVLFKDYNGDGYSDIALLHNWGAGNPKVFDYHVFLYDKNNNLFKYDLSASNATSDTKWRGDSV